MCSGRYNICALPKVFFPLKQWITKAVKNNTLSSRKYCFLFRVKEFFSSPLRPSELLYPQGWACLVPNKLITFFAHVEYHPTIVVAGPTIRLSFPRRTWIDNFSALESSWIEVNKKFAIFYERIPGKWVVPAWRDFPKRVSKGTRTFHFLFALFSYRTLRVFCKRV